MPAPTQPAPGNAAPAFAAPGNAAPTPAAAPQAQAAPSQPPAPTAPAASPTSAQIAAPTPAPTAAAIASDGAVSPDPDYESDFDDAGLSARGWKTDFRLHTVPYSEIRFVIPRDNIPSIDAPKFVSPADAGEWLQDMEPVVSLNINGDARAYPLQILTWHEIVNDEVGATPAAITFCPLCNSAIAFDRRLDGETLEFGVSGNLRNSDLIMYDRQTHTWWQQFTGEGIAGTHAGRELTHIPAFVVSFADFRGAYPEGKVLSRDTGFRRNYGRNPYAGYDTSKGNPFLFSGELDKRLLPVERVIAVSAGGEDAAFPLSALSREGVINSSVGGQRVALFHKFGTTSALDASSIADSRDVGAAAVFAADLNGDALTFKRQGGAIVDEQTGSVWNILGAAIEGELAGETLTPVVHGNHFWFAWAAFKPNTTLYEGNGGQ